MAQVYKARIKATGETIEVYKLNNGNYYDYQSAGEHEVAKSKTGKKEFKEEELDGIHAIK